ncbi:tryptophan halogenase family protein [Roseiterribacter gracilis]|uniref:Tryptophan halogenase n=1 Tax=Roseiterribacter gracilis TaxID=2812848 RepID=A0A8S8XIB5_9PROT|nr:tryptophan halogenase [Rhodospirillales bacterium TMPK1]
MARIQKILIVGGGTAGWLTACYLAKTLGAGRPGAIGIKLVESRDIGILGVGEGTWPTIRATLAAIGIDEARFIRESTATFKQGVHFAHWARAAGSAGADHYFHPFNQPSYKGDGLHLLPYWLLGAAGDVPFAEAATMQKRVVDASRAPKRFGDADYQGPMNYAFHFDASKFAALLSAHGKSLGVEHDYVNVRDVELDEQGAIAGIVTEEAGTLHADLYIDCSGFRALLIGKALGSAFRDVNDTLFADRALALQVPYDRPDAPIASCTIATGHEAGWTWDIGLHERRGTGYVYSSRHTDDARAEEILRAYVGNVGEGLTPRLLKFRTGYRETQWIKNCVAVGLSAGFLEPLESTGIGLIEMAAYLIGHLFPFDGDTTRVAAEFNAQMTGRFERVVDFLKLHYCLSQRSEPFWRDNVDPATIPATLQDKLAMWRCRPPHRLDFINDLEMFPPSSWQFVLYGMEFKTELAPARTAFPQFDAARQEFHTLRQVTGHAVNDLPPHRAYIDHVIRHGALPQRARVAV